MNHQIVKYDKVIYNESAIKMAIRDYQQIAVISYCQKEGAFACCFESSKYPMLLTIQEFSNYVLELTVQSERNNHVD